jgi:hypothetical protein
VKKKEKGKKEKEKRKEGVVDIKFRSYSGG